MRLTTIVVSSAALLLAAVPAHADWLVLRDGTRVETRGAWKEDGRLVVFTSKDGQLASLRTDAIDLAGSRRATAEAKAAAERRAAPREAAPAPAPSPPARRITNADIPAGRPAAAKQAAGEDDDEGEGRQPAAAAPPAAAELMVRGTAQEMDPVTGHLVVRGTLTNSSQRTAAAVELIVEAQGGDGQELGTLPANLEVEALPPGGSTAFEAHFYDVYSGAFALRFAPAATFLETTSEAGAAAGDGGALGDQP